MPSNQRENARREKQQQKERKTKYIIWCVLAIIAVALVVMKICEIDFNSVKNRFVNENGEISISSTANTSNYPFVMDSSKVKVSTVNDKLGLLTDSTVTILNPSDAKPVYEFAHGFANPIASFAGNYICIIDQGTNRFRLDSTTENIYESTTDMPILCADVSKRGRIIYATQGKETKSSVFVVNGKLETEMKLNVNDGYVVATAIDGSGKKIAYATVNSKDAKLVTTVHTYSVGAEKETASFEFVGSNIMDLHYSSSGSLFIVGTDFVSVVSNQKKLHNTFEIGSVNTVCFNYTDSGELVYAYEKYQGANENTICYVKNSGKVKTSVELNQRAKYVSSASNIITVLFNEEIVNYSLTSGKEKERFACDDAVSTANRMSSKIFVTRQQLVDVIG